MYNFDRPSTNASDIKEAIENIRNGQVVNIEVLQALADSISHISSKNSILKQIEVNFHRDNSDLGKGTCTDTVSFPSVFTPNKNEELHTERNVQRKRNRIKKNCFWILGLCKQEEN